MKTNSDFIPTRLIGIVSNTLYIDGLYAGDHFHDCTISDWTKSDLISRGVREFSSYAELDNHYTEVLYLEMFANDNPLDRCNFD
jgi:hypothetical protein